MCKRPSLASVGSLISPTLLCEIMPLCKNPFPDTNMFNRWIAESNGDLTYSNRAWHEHMGFNKSNVDVNDWTNAFSESSRPALARAWEKMKVELISQSFEAQLVNPWTTIDSLTGETVTRERWILCSAFPELNKDGTLNSVWGCNTDISHQKFAESLKEQRLHDVLEAKRQSENFIDMTRYSTTAHLWQHSGHFLTTC